MNVAHDGNKAADSIGEVIRETWVKACDCAGTSSGPRHAIEFEPFVPGDSLKFRMVWARIVCDDCQKAWKRTEVADADRRE